MFFKKELECPRCGSHKINTIKPSFKTQLTRFAWVMLFLPLALFVKPKQPLYVCQNPKCGFSWENR